MRYRSKKDAWIVALACSGFLIPFLLGVLFVMLGIPGGTGWLVLLIGIATGGFMLWLMVTTSYEITPASLIVRSGWLQREIALDTIQQVFPTNNPLSAPAWSLDRLQVDYSKDGRRRVVLISPEDKLRFMQDLAGQAGDVEVRDGRLVRRY